MPGNLVVGEGGFCAFHTLDGACAWRLAPYRLADSAMQGHAASSSAGENNQVGVCAAGRRVIVKFSPTDDARGPARPRSAGV
jgi:hypothetical protein